MACPAVIIDKWPVLLSLACPAVILPPEIARAQGKHGFRGAAHGIKGGRPRLDLTEEERSERRRQQQEGYRRRQGIPPKEVRPLKVRPTNWLVDYMTIWGKRLGEPLTPDEFAEREPLWNVWVAERWGMQSHLLHLGSHYCRNCPDPNPAPFLPRAAPKSRFDAVFKPAARGTRHALTRRLGVNSQAARTFFDNWPVLLS